MEICRLRSIFSIIGRFVDLDLAPINCKDSDAIRMAGYMLSLSAFSVYRLPFNVLCLASSVLRLAFGIRVSRLGFW